MAEAPEPCRPRPQRLPGRLRRRPSVEERPWLPEMTAQERRWLDWLMGGLLLAMFVSGVLCRLPGSWRWLIVWAVTSVVVVFGAVAVFVLVIARRHRLPFWSTYLDGVFFWRRRRVDGGSAVTPPE